MTLTYDHTQDYYYLKGIAAAREEAVKEIEQEREKAEQQIAQEREKAKQEKIDTIQSLLSIGTLSITQIAEAMNVTEEFVEKISKEEDV